MITKPKVRDLPTLQRIVELNWIDIIYKISHVFTIGPDINEILEGVLKSIGKRMNAKMLALWLLDKKGIFYIAASYNVPKEYVEFSKTKEGRLSKGQGVIGAVTEKREQLVIENVYKNPLTPRPYVRKLKRMKFIYSSLLSSPLVVEGKGFGALNFYFAETRDEGIPEIERKIVKIISDQIAGFIKNSQMYKELEDKTFELTIARNSLETERNKISAIINNFTDPIIFIDNTNALNLFNPAAEEVLGMGNQDIGKKVSRKNNLSLENFRTFIHRGYKLKELMSEEEDRFMEEMTTEIDGQERVYRITTVEVCDDKGICYGYIKIFYDLTREKIIDKLKSEFISVAAHQLRTPLSAIKWVIKMVLDGDAGELKKEQEELLLKGYKSNERMINLVNDLLNVSRIEEGRSGYIFKKSNFQEVLDIVISNSEREIAKNHLKLILKKPKQMPEIQMDKERMVMVVQNILDNAIKYTPEYGRIEVCIKKINSNLQVSIKDSGVGIPAEDKVKLFSKFFRASNVVRLQTEGTGLGLFITKNIVEKHGGKVFLESEEGRGTEVKFILPIRSKNK